MSETSMTKSETAASRTDDKLFGFIPLRRGPNVAVIRMAGVIGAEGGLRRKGLSLEALAPAIDRAFSLKRLVAVALVINSPGGSPVQSDLIARRIRDLADEKEVPVIAFCEDAAASGGYWIACAADEIYAMPASIVGSIGVVSAGFGFVDAIAKLGVERRVHTAGESKSILDPFQPEKDEDLKVLKRIQEDLHGQFKDWVAARRGDKLNEDEDLFTGAFWTGRESLPLGLIDGLGDPRSVLRARFGEKVRFRPVVRPKSRLQRLLGMESRSGSAIAEAAIDSLEDRAAWRRIGL
jgi:signal peptide peptidase SppA